MPRLSIRLATVSVSSPAIIAIARFSSGIPIIGSFPTSVPCFNFSKSAKVAIRSSHLAPRRSGAALSERSIARLALMCQIAVRGGQTDTSRSRRRVTPVRWRPFTGPAFRDGSSISPSVTVLC
jgi:hypothetical protein